MINGQRHLYVERHAGVIILKYQLILLLLQVFTGVEKAHKTTPQLQLHLLIAKLAEFMTLLLIIFWFYFVY